MGVWEFGASVFGQCFEKKLAVLREQKPCLVWRKLGMRKNKSCRHMLKTAYPPTPALAKAGAAPGTTAGVELVFLSFKCLNASRQIRSACRLPPQPSLGTPNRAGKS